MTIFVTSDLHFNHRGIIGYCNRPFEDVGAMNAALIRAWRQVVLPSDEVWVLGDFGFPSGAAPLPTIFEMLPGRKHLVVGNHDEQNRKVLALPWESQHHYFKLRYEGRRAILCHYPLESWDGAHKGYIHLHGHCHGNLKRLIPHRYDVGVDGKGIFFPYPRRIDDFFAWADAQTFEPQDHHEEGRD